MQWTVEQWQQLVSHVAYNRELGIEFAELVPTGIVLRLRYRSDLASSPDGQTLTVSFYDGHAFRSCGVLGSLGMRQRFGAKPCLLGDCQLHGLAHA